MRKREGILLSLCVIGAACLVYAVHHITIGGMVKNEALPVDTPTAPPELHSTYRLSVADLVAMRDELELSTQWASYSHRYKGTKEQKMAVIKELSKVLTSRIEYYYTITED